MQHPARVGKYEIEQFLGGGMAAVYRARDGVLGRRVALKMLSENSDAEAKARFLQEARTASNLNHENVVAVYDLGEENGRPFMVMEYLEGESLRAALRDGSAGDFTKRIQIALQVARALEYIHSRKIIHRDVKPENIYLDPLGRVKLMDFGIAKLEGVNLTRTGFTLGTPYYMSPEQVAGQAITLQSDVYAFGVLLFELLTGRKAVEGTGFEEVFEQVLHQPLPVEPLHEAGVPPLLIAMMKRCTAKAPADRAQGLGAICGQLETLLEPAQRKPRRSPDLAAVTSPTVTPSHMKWLQKQTGPETRSTEADGDLPMWLHSLPAPMKTHAGLMTLSAAIVLLIALAVVEILRII